MKYKLVKLQDLSGQKASVYSVVQSGETVTLFEKFLLEHKDSFISETNSFLIRLKTVSTKTGAREQFFKLNEGLPGDGVCALYDEPASNLRLYCIRYGSLLVVVGHGGHKPKTVRKLKDVKKLKDANDFLRWLSAEITQRIKDKEIEFRNEGRDFSGDLTFLSDKHSEYGNQDG